MLELRLKRHATERANWMKALCRSTLTSSFWLWHCGARNNVCTHLFAQTRHHQNPVIHLCVGTKINAITLGDDWWRSRAGEHNLLKIYSNGCQRMQTASNDKRRHIEHWTLAEWLRDVNIRFVVWCSHLRTCLTLLMFMLFNFCM